ncbi:hypothetical protein [Nonomuraea cavernae]|uniref:Uncharacterized protein n=1 Tax=Nonomuraea cavernae TaxID=2045107 RepID=A0A918DL74_9ACTN|nr:hypothetical protein [Nonomuraea cavernae]MCA2186101.1 hypothetical protein [Nonomuraea cavernae]GGO70208.1 hypothetical protein GCM10012289_33120 [Nonomuraea cavernae]
MDSESLAAAGLLAALSRAAGLLAELQHPFVRSEPFSYFVPPAGARTGIAFTLPDGRELCFAVSIVVSEGAFHVDGSVAAEGEALLELPRKTTPDIREGLAVLDDYTGELMAPAGRLIDEQLDNIV